MSVRWRPDRKRWMVDIEYTHTDGRKERVRESFRTKKSAERREREIMNALEASKWQREEVSEQKTQVSLEEFAEEFIDTYARVNNKPSEVLSKTGILERYLKPILGPRDLDQIKVREIERLKAILLKRQLSPKTVNNALAVLGKMLRYAEEIEIIDKAPRIRLLKVPRPDFDFLTFDEADQLLEAAKYNPEWYAMVFFALRTGVRYGELCELRWSDVNLRNGRLMVRRGYYMGHVTTPKGGREREIPLSPQLVSFLKTYRHLRSELVFCKTTGDRRLYDGALDALRFVCKKAGLRRIGWHVLRHTFASHLIMKGVPIKTVQELLGHATIEMTMRYAHLSPEVKRDAVVLLDEPSHTSGTIAAPKPNYEENRWLNT